MNGNENFVKIIDYLKEAAASVRELEAEAEDALLNKDDVDIYRSKLEQKAMLIIDLESEIEDSMTGLDPTLSRRIRGGLSRFALSAERGLGLGSLFYLSALLYPEDHVEGEKNDLENFIGFLERSL
ncbi:MAG: hypothetical protein V3V37_09160 [Candidatus Adiutricales bacterium]